MNELMIIAFALATVRTLIPLASKENFKLPNLTLAIFTSWAFWHLIYNCATITFK